MSALQRKGTVSRPSGPSKFRHTTCIFSPEAEGHVVCEMCTSCNHWLSVENTYSAALSRLCAAHIHSYALRGVPIKYQAPIFVPDLLRLPAGWKCPTLPSERAFGVRPSSLLLSMCTGGPSTGHHSDRSIWERGSSLVLRGGQWMR